MEGRIVRDEEVTELGKYDGEFKVVSNLDKADYYSQLPPVEPINIGLPLINDYLNGITPGELVVIAGHPKSGKSTLARTLIRNLSLAGHPPLVLSYEEPDDQLLNKFDNWSRDIVFYMPDKMKAFDVNWVEERCLEAREKYGVDIVFVDHGQFLFEVTAQTNALTVGNAAKRVKNIARENKIIIFLMWHLSKPDNKVASVTTMNEHQLRDTQVLLNELDSLLLTYRGVKGDGIVQTEESYVKVQMTRRSGVYDRIVPINKVGNYFEEVGVYL